MSMGGKGRFALERFKYDTILVLPRDKVRTRTGRQGVCYNTSGKDTAIVYWDDGEIFPMRFCHLEVLAHNCELPKKHQKYPPKFPPLT